MVNLQNLHVTREIFAVNLEQRNPHEDLALKGTNGIMFSMFSLQCNLENNLVAKH